MKRLGLLCLVLVAHGCAAARPPEAGSQTHFLHACDARCAAPYQCLCGLCSLPCSDESGCARAPDAAMCLPSSTGLFGCEAAPRMCDVACDVDGDCALLGSEFACSDGRCRTISGVPVDAPMSEPGSLADVLCNGSDQIQLLLQSHGGLLWQYNSTHAIFAMVDGHCHYYVENGYMNGIRQGVLSASQADQLAHEVNITRLKGWTEPPLFQCSDGGSQLIATPAAAISCECGECSGAQAASKKAAITSADTWLARLAMQGSPVSGAVWAMAIQDNFAGFSQQPVAWPLARPMGSIDGFVKLAIPTDSSQGARFDDAGEAMTLRELRGQVATIAGFVAIQDGDMKYDLYVRDELPADVDQALTAFEADAQLLLPR
jgi:hypothetical protein